MTISTKSLIQTATTSQLHALIPQIWADTIIRNLYKAVHSDWEKELTPADWAAINRKRKRFRHYLKKAKWGKQHAKRRTKRRP